MKFYSEKINISSQKNDFLDLTGKVQEIINNAEIEEGLCVIFVKHTTCFLIINENEPNLKNDLLEFIFSIVPENRKYKHDDGNAHAHLKKVLFDSGKTIPVSQRKLDLGTWQSLLFFDPDGPRKREILVRVMGN